MDQTGKHTKNKLTEREECNMNIYKELRRLAIKMDADVSNTHNIRDVMAAMAAKLDGTHAGAAIADVSKNMADVHTTADTLRGLTLDVDISASEDLLGKVVSDLQVNAAISGDSIVGTSYYVPNYTGFSGDADLQKGNYIVVHASVPDVSGVTISVTSVDKLGMKKTKALDSDGILIFRITDAKTEKLIFTAEKEGYQSYSKTYDLTGVHCEKDPLASLVVTASDDLVVREATISTVPSVSGEIETSDEEYDVTFTAVLKNVSDVTITVAIGDEDPVELVDDEAVVSVTNEDTRALIFTVSSDEYGTYTRAYSLTGIVLSEGE